MRVSLALLVMVASAGCKTTNEHFEGGGGAAGGEGGLAWPGGDAEGSGAAGGDEGGGGEASGGGGEASGGGGDAVGGAGGDIGGAGGAGGDAVGGAGGEGGVAFGGKGGALGGGGGDLGGAGGGAFGGGGGDLGGAGGDALGGSGGDVVVPECDDGSQARVPCGLNGRGLQARLCLDGAWSDDGGCLDPDACVDDSRQRAPCGLNARGHEQRLCHGGAWSEWSACDDADVCVDGATDAVPCGLNAMGRSARLCAGGQWGAFPGCDDPDECPNGEREADPEPCGVDGRGERFRTCAGGRWTEYGACDDPDRVCEDGRLERVPCGLNGRGEQTRTCEGGRWSALGECVDDEVCVDRAEQSQPCGLNGAGRRGRSCADGGWSAWTACVDLDVCVNGAADEGACGLNGRGVRTRSCLDGQWAAFGGCVDFDECVDGVVQREGCGDGGTHDRTCGDGRWPAWSECVVPELRCDPAASAYCRRCTDALEVNDRPDRARPVQSGDYAHLTACADVDLLDYYRLDLDGPTDFRVSVDWFVRPGVLRVDLHVLDEAGNSLGFPGSLVSAERGSRSVEGFIPRPGRYYIRLTARENDVPYTMQVRLVPVPLCEASPPGLECIDCSDQFFGNRGSDNAAVLAPGVYRDLETCPNANDWYVLPIDAPSVVRFELRPTLASGYTLLAAFADDVQLGRESGFAEGVQWEEVTVDRPLRLEAVVGAGFGAARYDLSVTVTPIVAPDCRNAQDDDRDGRVDAADFGCLHGEDDDEADPAMRPACANGADDDGDGHADFGADPNCEAAGDLDEASPCNAAPVQVIDVRTPGRYVADTRGAPRHYEIGCDFLAGGGQVVFAVHLDERKVVRAEVLDATFDTVLSARTACDDDASELGCNDDIGGGVLLSRLLVPAGPGPAFFLLEGYNDAEGAATVEFTLIDP